MFSQKNVLSSYEDLFGTVRSKVKWQNVNSKLFNKNTTMKRQVILIGLIAFFFIKNVSAQDQPGIDLIARATVNVMAFKFEKDELRNFIRYDEEPIKYIHGNFSGLNRKECLVICPMMRQTGTAGAYQNFVMLFYKSVDGTWNKGKFAVLEQQVDTMDLNNDKLPELICKNGWMWNGESNEKTTIYQLKGDAEKVLYSNESEYRTMTMFLKVGDEAEKIYEISFIDLNTDGIYEIEEKLATGIVESINNYEPTLYYKKTKKTLKLINGKYQ